MLHYRGPLRSNGDALHKQQIRNVLSKQPAQPWAQPPLTDDPSFLMPRQQHHYCFLRDVAGVHFQQAVNAAGLIERSSFHPGWLGERSGRRRVSSACYRCHRPG